MNLINLCCLFASSSSSSLYKGTPWYAAERYADMSKTLFLALFYSVLYPSGLFVAFFGYSFCYTVDKYSLLRTWRTPAEVRWVAWIGGLVRWVAWIGALVRWFIG